jgi:hypothetical protein
MPVTEEYDVILVHKVLPSTSHVTSCIVMHVERRDQSEEQTTQWPKEKSAKGQITIYKTYI